MNSRKCSNCGLTNFADTQTCKRCNQSLLSPNQSLPRQRKAKEIPADAWVCLSCGKVISPFMKTKGSNSIEVLLLIFSIAACFVLNYFIGALLFIVFVVVCVWRSLTKQKVCPSCESPQIIPSNSPMAQEHLARL